MNDQMAGDSLAGSPSEAVSNGALLDWERSTHPVGQEWRELVSAVAAMEPVHRMAYEQWQARIQTCMADRGFAYALPSFVDERRVEFFRALNPLNEEYASIRGYHAPSIPVIPELNTDESIEFIAALHGTDDNPSEGCGSLAFETVYRVLDPAGDALQLLLNELDARVEAYGASPEGRAQIERWAECMNAYGYSVRTRDDLAERYVGSDEVSLEEIDARLIDIACDRETMFTEQRSAWERAEVERWLDERGPALTELDELINEASDGVVQLAAER